MTAGHAEPADLIHLVSRQAQSAQIRFGDCETVVTLKASTDALGVTQVAQSHWIRIPGGGRAQRLRGFPGLAAGRALGAAIGDLAFQFNRAQSQGLSPDESWFVPAPALVGGD